MYHAVDFSLWCTKSFTAHVCTGAYNCHLLCLVQTNAILVVYTKVNGDLEEIGRTEVILNSMEPLWVTRTIINYRFAIVQLLV